MLDVILTITLFNTTLIIDINLRFYIRNYVMYYIRNYIILHQTPNDTLDISLHVTLHENVTEMACDCCTVMLCQTLC